MKQAGLPRIFSVGSIFACLLAIVFCGCQPRPSDKIEVRVIVTQDFGNKLMLDEPVRIDGGGNAMDALIEVATVETKYGGGFVEAINGVRSQYSGTKVKRDWLFYINGTSASVGGRDYKLSDGDIEHWDFHDWSISAFIPAIIGDFPQPFLGGYQGKTLPTIVAYDKGFPEAAQHLVNKLKELEVENIHSRAAAELTTEDKKYSNLILLGTQDFDLVSELNKNYKRLGFYACFENGKVTTFGPQGNKSQYQSSCGVIQATQNPWNPGGLGAGKSVVWIVSGISETAVRDSLTTLTRRFDELRYAFAAVIINGQTIKVPQ